MQYIQPHSESMTEENALLSQWPLVITYSAASLDCPKLTKDEATVEVLLFDFSPAS